MRNNEILQCLERLEAKHQGLAERVAKLEAALHSLSSPSEPSASPVVYEPREAELRWLAEHPEVLTQHAGQWIALAGPELVAAGRHLDDVATAAQARGVTRPLVMFIPADPQDYLLGMSNQLIDN